MHTSAILISRDIVSSYIWWIIAVLLLILLLQYFRVWLRAAILVTRLPGPLALPIIGNLLQFRNKECFTQIVIKLYKKNVPLVRIWVTIIPVVVLFSADHVQRLLSSRDHIHKSSMYNVLKQFLGNALITGSGQYWERHRKMISPTFHLSVLENFVPMFVQNSQRMVANMKSFAESGTPFDVTEFSFSCTLDIICETAMGTPVNAQEGDLFKEFFTASKAALDIMMHRMFHPWLLLDCFFKITSESRAIESHYKLLKDLTNKVIQIRRTVVRTHLLHEKNNEIDVGQKKRSVFLDLLLQMQEKGCGLSDIELMHEVNTFIVAGHETSSQTASFCLYLLGRHPQIQEQIFKELDNIFEESDRNATLEDLRNMKYLERCIMETLRLFPSAPAIGRKLTTDLQLGQHIVPSGCEVMIPIMLIHRQEEHYPDPHHFNPDNFLPQKIQQRHPYAYLPFSAGPRNCIGQKFAMFELKALLSTVLRSYRIETITRLHLRDLEWRITLKTREPLLIKLLTRKAS